MPRLGLHVHQNHKKSDIISWYHQLQPSMILFLSVDDVFVRDIKAVSPGTKAFGRIVVNSSEQQTGGDAAKAFLTKLKNKALEHPTIDYWIGYNESFSVPGEIGRYAKFEIDRMKMLESIGRKAAIGGFSQGELEITDDGDEWAEFRPALEHALRNGHVLHLHEYAGSYIGYGVNTPDGKNQWDHPNNRFTGYSTDPNIWKDPRLTGWHTLRYRMVYDLFRSWDKIEITLEDGTKKRKGFDELPLYISEFGNDDTVPRPGPPGAGYKNFKGTEWARIPGVGDFPEQCHLYMWHASHNPYLKGVVLYGWDGTSLGWGSFDCSNDPPTRDKIIATQGDLPVGHFGAPTPQPPIPPPEVKMLQGIDVSRWQGAMDWSKAKAAGTVYAWIKASEGSTWVDPQFATNARGAGSSGILWGAYHYYRNDIDALAQARHFVATVTAAGIPTPTLTYALDFEDTTGRVDPRAMGVFAAEVERLTGSRPLVYTARWWWTPARLGGRQEWAARLPLWIADYSPESVPLPATGEWSRWTVLQYTSSGDGAQHGAASDRIDLNRFDGTRDALIAAVGYSKPAGIDLARLWHEARENQAIRLNPDSAIQKAMAAAGKVPIGNEWAFSPDEQAQLAESLAGTGAAVFVWDRRDGKVTRYNQP